MAWACAWAASLLVAVPVRAADRPADRPAERPLLLDVRINGQRLADVVEARQLADGRLVLADAIWREMRLLPAGDALLLADGLTGHALDTAVGLRYTLDSRRLQLDIDAPPALFAAQAVNAGSGIAAPPPRPGVGALLNYDVVAMPSAGNASRGGSGFGGVFETVVFGPFGSVVASALATTGGAAGQKRLTRLDTAWQVDWPERMQTLVVGDTVGTGGGWSRPVRYGGIRFGRDFALQPGFVSVPQATLGGSAALPSAVDILVNGQQRMSQAVQPGAFEVTNVPLVSGAGEVNLVVRDLLGRETVVRQNYYSSPRILADGVSDYLFEAGRLRMGYGASTDDYGDLFGAATWRQGLGRIAGLGTALTVEGRAEWMRDRQAAGVEVAGLIGTWGVARAALAGSRSTAGTVQQGGTHWSVGLERNGAGGGLQMLLEGFGRGFTQFAAVAGEAQPRQRMLLGAWAPLWGNASGAATWTRQTSWNAADVGVLGLTLNFSVFKNMSLALSLGRQYGNQPGWRAGLALAMPLAGADGSSSHLSTSVDRAGDGSLSATANASQAAPAGPGLGWYLRASDRRSTALAGGVNYNTALAELSAEAEAGRDGHADLRLGARGSLGWAGGLAFASRPLGQGAFAVVQVGDQAGVPVLRSHQVVAYTNDRGLALVPGLLPYETNLIGIDTAELPLDADVRAMQLKLTPYARSAVVADFGLRRRRSALVELVLADGSPVPAGARVTLPRQGAEIGAAPFLVARRGEVYLEGLQSDNDIEARWDGRRCVARVQLDAAQQGTVPRIGPLACTVPQGAWVASS